MSDFTIQAIDATRRLHATVADDPTQTLLTSDAWTRGGVRFPAPRAVIEPILERLEQVGLPYVAAGKYQQARTVVDRETGDDHTAYGRWCVEFRTTQERAGDVQIYDTLGVMVATDLSVPKIQVYRGPVVASCLNLSIWGADDLRKLSGLGEGFAAVEGIVGQWIDEIHTDGVRYHETLRALASVRWDRERFDRLLGAIYREAVLHRSIDLSTLGKAVDYLFGPVPTPYSASGDQIGADQFLGALTDVVSNGEKMPLNQRAPKIHAVCRLVGGLPGVALAAGLAETTNGHGG